MTKLPDFRLETHFSTWEFKAKYHLTASDAESISLADLLILASSEDRQAFENLWLGYTQTYGDPQLRATIASTYEKCNAEEILCFAGASEGIFAANTVLLDSDSHAIVITPSYQSHETLPVSLGSATAVPLNPDEGWSLDVDRVASAIRPNTRLLTINFPHNPTGAILPLDRYLTLIDICRKHGIVLLHDEIFHGLGPSGTKHLPFVADLYERGMSLNVMSKSFGLPGLRIGWIACQDKELLSQMEKMKHYLSICSSAPSEKLSIIALKNKKKLLARNNAIIDANLLLWDSFFAKHAKLFEWQHPEGSCIAFPRYKGSEGIEVFAKNLIEKSGVLVLPSSIYKSDLGAIPLDRFRIGLGRLGLADGLAAMDQFLSSDT